MPDFKQWEPLLSTRIVFNAWEMPEPGHTTESTNSRSCPACILFYGSSQKKHLSLRVEAEMDSLRKQFWAKSCEDKIPACQEGWWSGFMQVQEAFSAQELLTGALALNEHFPRAPVLEVSQWPSPVWAGLTALYVPRGYSRSSYVPHQSCSVAPLIL